MKKPANFRGLNYYTTLMLAFILNQLINNVRDDGFITDSALLCETYVPIKVDNINLTDARVKTDLGPVSTKSGI